MQNPLALLITLVFGFDVTCGVNVNVNAKCSNKLQLHMMVNATGRFAFSLLLFGPHLAVCLSPSRPFLRFFMRFCKAPTVV